MKKIILSIALMLLFGFKANAEVGVKAGISLAAGVFSVDGASEKFTGSHSSGAAVGDVTKKASDEGEDAEALFGIGSLFIEKSLGDKFSVGLDYVPYALESETTENTQRATKDNKEQPVTTQSKQREQQREQRSEQHREQQR